MKGSLFIFSLNIHVTTLRFYFKGIFHNFYKTSISLSILNHCQPPKYSCHRYCCGDEKGNYDRDDTAYDDDDDDDGGDVDEIVEGLQVQSV